MNFPSGREYRGPKPKMPPTVAHAIDELITRTEKWLRRYEESSFYRTGGIPATEFGFNEPGDLNAIPKLCDYAIEAVVQLAEFSKEAESKLAEAKTEAEKRIKQQSSEGE